MSVVMTFNSVTSTTMGFTVIEVQKPLIAPVEQTVINIPKYRGTYQSNRKFSTNEITVRGYVIGTSYADLVTKLKALSGYLYSETDETLSFDDESDRAYQAQHVETVITHKTYRVCYLDLIFTCHDPFAYDTTATTDSQTITSSGTTYVVANAGHTYAFPVITITFNADQQHVYVANNTIVDDVANRFDISKAFSSGDVLVVDCKNGTIKLNGANSPAGFGDGGSELAEWIMLAVGSNELEVGTTDESINVDVDISFEKVYLY